MILTQTIFENYKSTFIVFFIIIIAKIFQSLSVLYGAEIIINKLFKANLMINLTALVLNIIMSYILFYKLDLIGVALASLAALIIRYLLLIRLNKKIKAQKKQ